MVKQQILKQAFADAKTHFHKIRIHYALFIVVCLASLALNYFVPFSLLLSGPLFILPSLFSIQCLLINSKKTNDDMRVSAFFHYFKEAYRSYLRSIYRPLNSLAISIGVFFGVYICSSLVVIYSSLWNDPSFLAMVEELEINRDVYTYEQIVYSVINNESFINGIEFAIVFALFPSVYMFAHNVLTNSINLAAIFHLSDISYLNLSLSIFRRAFKSFRKSFYKNYYAVAWLLIISSIVGYVSLTLLSYYIFKLPFYSCASLGLAGAFVICSIFLPMLFMAIDVLARQYLSHYIKSGINEANIILNSFLNEEQDKEEIEKYIKDSEEILNKISKNSKDNNDREK